MPWIKQIDEKNAEGKLKEVYSDIEKSRGKISNIMKIHSLDPDTMKHHLDMYLAIMFNDSSLDREERELIAVVVSALNNCSYCANHHAEALNVYWKDQAKIDMLISDYKSIDFPIRTLAILNYAEKLTITPDLVNEYDVQNLRIHDLADKDILNINLVVSYFNFVNRIANGLGVEFSEEEVKGYKY
ncbi:MAG: peroxidase-related enzyme [Ignavibacteriae bacterium]|nr:peroxidase-related enzyme [Ignavibacteriota bacterium]MCB9208136.1 peroxidase-related enzyme [Ignavibacteriales bacterium]MCB9258901.1 peroxidase-related enzyme [Ignavibacteriales bacterium]